MVFSIVGVKLPTPVFTEITKKPMRSTETKPKSSGWERSTPDVESDLPWMRMKIGHFLAFVVADPSLPPGCAEPF